MDEAITIWLLQGDPAIRWQVYRDLLKSEPHQVNGEQKKIATEGWGATHSSFHTTINGLEGLWVYENFKPERRLIIRESRQGAVNFLLIHRLFRSHRNGRIVDPKITRLSFPPRWRYDILRILDFFQECKIPYDPRMEDALEILRKKQLNDGTWPLQNRHAGKTWFEMETVGQPSSWNTLRALRVLKWFDGKDESETFGKSE
ncbi:MAG: hypothetical protein Kow0042_14170 [Calditrichia bacterium]